MTIDKANILIAINEQLIAEGIKASLERNFSATCLISGLESEQQILTDCGQHDIDIVILDVDYPDQDSVHFIQKLVSCKNSDIQVLAITKGKDNGTLQKIVAAGVKGMVLKSAGMDHLYTALQEILNGKYFFCNEVTYLLVHDFVNEGQPERDYHEGLLTEREHEILELICQELTNREIAEKLQISTRTVDSHRSNLLQKTNSKNTVGLVKYALKNNIVDIS